MAANVKKGTPKQIEQRRKALKPVRKGEIKNPTGRNGWIKAREEIAELAGEHGAELFEVLQKIAKNRNMPSASRVAAAKAALGPVLNHHTIGIEPESARTFAELMRAAKGVEE